MTEISEAISRMSLASWLKMAQNPWIAIFMSSHFGEKCKKLIIPMRLHSGIVRMNMVD